MDLNAAKYPADGMFYTDIKSYEQGAGQHISKESNRLPALSCLPINKNWFWKKSFPTDPVKDPKVLVNEDIIPFNKVYCNFILNVAPNRDGLIDDNALKALSEVGKLWKNEGPVAALLPCDAPVISSNLAKHRPAESSWSNDMDIMDFANDDNFNSCWNSNRAVKEPWWQVNLDKELGFNMITIVEGKVNISKYRIEYEVNGAWKTLLTGDNASRVKVHRFNRVWGDKVRIRIDGSATPPVIAEVGVYDERRGDK
jgi:alpha-L-fucosidase